MAAGLITGGRLGDLYGRRRMFALGLALFTLASLAWACSWRAAAWAW
jgi:MFS family permease